MRGYRKFLEELQQQTGGLSPARRRVDCGIDGGEESGEYLWIAVQRLDHSQVSHLRNAAGELVRRVRDQSGTIIEYVQDAAGKLSNIRIVQ